MAGPQTKIRVALVGAGHGHLHALHNAAELRAAGLEPILVAPSQFHYSGLATGVLSGALGSDEARVDVAGLAARLGVEHRSTETVGVDLRRGVVHLKKGGDIAFDRVSFNIGSLTRDPLGLGSAPGVWTAKPLARLFELKDRIVAFVAEQGRGPAVVVAGGGQSGFEIAAAITGLLERHGVRPQVRLVATGPAAWAPRAAITSLERAMDRRGVVFVSGDVTERLPGACVLSDGRRLDCDMLVLATGLEAPPILRDLGLPLDGVGRLRVTPGLRSIAHEAVFAVGDCAVIDEEPRPMAGVFGVRAAPILLRNLMGGADVYRPQSRWLAIMDLGNGQGLAMRGRLWWLGRSALWLKRRLDLGFIRRVRRPT